MKKLFKIILGATVGSTLLLSSCNFLDVDPYFEATFKEDSIFHSKKNAEGYLWNTPKGFPDAGAIWGNSWNPGESASDEITLKYQTILGTTIFRRYHQQQKSAYPKPMVRHVCHCSKM